MIEKTICDYLEDALGVPTFMEVPEMPPEEYIVLEKTGSSVENHIYSATLAIQSVSRTLYGAAVLNEAVKDAMENAIELSDVTHSELNSDYNFTDTETKQYRYQAVFDLTHY